MEHSTARTNLALSKCRLQRRGNRNHRKGVSFQGGSGYPDDTLLIEWFPILHIQQRPDRAQRLHLRFDLGRVDYPECVE